MHRNHIFNEKEDIKSTDDGVEFTVPADFILDTTETQYYSLRYDLKVKDKTELQKIMDKVQSAKAKGENYNLSNTVDVQGDKSSASFEYIPPVISKTAKQTANDPKKPSRWTVDYVITLNDKELDLIPNGDTYQVTDEPKNVQIDYSSIKFYGSDGSTELTGCSWDLDPSTGKITFNVPDNQKVLIKYQGIVIRTGDSTAATTTTQYSNKATVSYYTAEQSNWATFDLNAAGSGNNYALKLIKYDVNFP